MHERARVLGMRGGGAGGLLVRLPGSGEGLLMGLTGGAALRAIDGNGSEDGKADGGSQGGEGGRDSEGPGAS